MELCMECSQFDLQKGLWILQGMTDILCHHFLS